MIARVLLLSFLALSAHKKKKPAAPPAQAVDLSAWADSHPDAAASLGDWVKENQSAARAFFAWDEANRKNTHGKTFLSWALQQRGESVAQFSAAHADWKDFAKITAAESVGLDRLVRWCADHPTPAEELEPAVAPFAWFGKHLYTAELNAPAAKDTP